MKLMFERKLVKSLAECFAEAIESIPDEAGLQYNYVCLQTARGEVNVRVDGVLKDGYWAEGSFYPFSAFRAVSPEDYGMIREHEIKVLSLIKERDSKLKIS